MLRVMLSGGSPSPARCPGLAIPNLVRDARIPPSRADTLCRHWTMDNFMAAQCRTVPTPCTDIGHESALRCGHWRSPERVAGDIAGWPALQNFFFEKVMLKLLIQRFLIYGLGIVAHVNMAEPAALEKLFNALARNKQITDGAFNPKLFAEIANAG